MIGDRTSQVSTPQDKLYGVNIAIAGTDVADGHPKHTPEVPRQSCLDIATGIVHEWYAGAWH